MKLFSPLYRLALVWARHRHAPWYLGGMSFVESSFFPVPPDVMLAPMCLAQPHRAWHLALLTTLTSVAGGLLGYAIGYFAIDALLPWLQESRYWPAYQTAVEWRWSGSDNGASGLCSSPASRQFPTRCSPSRPARFPWHSCLLPLPRSSGAARASSAWGGARMEAALHRHVDRLGWATVAALAVGLLAFR